MNLSSRKASFSRASGRERLKIKWPPGSRGILGLVVLILLLAAALWPNAFARTIPFVEELLVQVRVTRAENQVDAENIPSPLRNSTLTPANTVTKEAAHAANGLHIVRTPGATPTVFPSNPSTPRPTLPLVSSSGTAPTPSARSSPTPVPIPTSTPIFASQPAALRIELEGLTHIWQKWNNCGPATLAMHLSYFGIERTQAETAAALKPNKDDVNVSPQELAAYARSQGLQAKVGVNGNADLLRLLLTNGLPVLVETWHEPEPGDGMGHYRLLTGYDDAKERWIAFDSYISVGVDGSKPYRGIYLDYGELEELWAVFNRTYIVLYTGELSPLVLDIVGQDMDEAKMWRKALSQARTTVEQHPGDAFAWFNLGTDLVALAEFEEAAAAYDRAREIGLLWRMLWYQFGPFQAYYEVGRVKDLVALADTTLLNVDDSEELYYWKGQGLAVQGDMAGAKLAWNQSMQLNPNYAEAAEALVQVNG